MQLMPDTELINLPNILLIIFSTMIALVVIHLVSMPFESDQ